jgi:hypothetical protein
VAGPSLEKTTKGQPGHCYIEFGLDLIFIQNKASITITIMTCLARRGLFLVCPGLVFSKEVVNNSEVANSREILNLEF